MQTPFNRPIQMRGVEIDKNTGVYKESNAASASAVHKLRYLQKSIDRICLFADEPFTWNRAKVASYLLMWGYTLKPEQAKVLANWVKRT